MSSAMFVLILTVGGMEYSFIHSVPGFTSLSSCEIAADKWKNDTGHTKGAICVETK